METIEKKRVKIIYPDGSIHDIEVNSFGLYEVNGDDKYIMYYIDLKNNKSYYTFLENINGIWHKNAISEIALDKVELKAKGMMSLDILPDVMNSLVTEKEKWLEQFQVASQLYSSNIKMDIELYSSYSLNQDLLGINNVSNTTYQSNGEVFYVNMHDKVNYCFERSNIPSMVKNGIYEWIRNHHNEILNGELLEVPDFSIKNILTKPITFQVPILSNDNKVQIALALMLPGEYIYHVSFAKCKDDLLYKEALDLENKKLNILGAIEEYFNFDKQNRRQKAFKKGFLKEYKIDFIKSKQIFLRRDDLYDQLVKTQQSNTTPSNSPVVSTKPIVTIKNTSTGYIPQMQTQLQNKKTKNTDNESKLSEESLYIPEIIYISSTNDIYIPVKYSSDLNLEVSEIYEINNQKYIKVDNLKKIVKIVQSTSTQSVYPVSIFADFNFDEKIISTSNEKVLLSTKALVDKGGQNSKIIYNLFNQNLELSSISVEKLKKLIDYIYSIKSSSNKVLKSYLKEIAITRYLSDIDLKKTIKL